MITMKHVPSGRTMELADTEATKRRILERCGWAEVVEMAEEPVTSLLEDTAASDDGSGDIPEEEEQPNDGGNTTTSDDAAPARPAKTKTKK